jgi:hypothetical protein
MGRAVRGGFVAVNRILAPAALLAAVSAWFFQAFVGGGDLFWHLASGREIWRRGSIPFTDPFSYSFEGRPWQNHEWLWDALYWGAYRITPDAVAWLNVAVLVAVFGLTYLTARSTSHSRLAAGAAVWLAAASSYWFLDIRPHLFTLLGVAFLLWSRDRRWAPWSWPGLVALWANLHAGFVFGLGAIGVLVLVRTLEAGWRERRLVVLRREWLGLGLSGLAWMVNPWGWRIAEYPLAYLHSGSAYRGLLEWFPPPFGLDPRFYEGRFWDFALLASAGLLAGGHRQRDLAALSAVALGMAATSRRFIPLFLVVATPLAAVAIGRLRDAIARRSAIARTSAAELATSVVVLGVAAAMWSHVRIGPSLLRRWAMSDTFPEAAVRYLDALGPPERVLDHYNWGGFVMLEAPGARVFIDGRANTLYDEPLLADYLELLAGRVTPELLARHPADVALLPNSRLASALLALDPPWKPLYRDDVATLLAPPGSPLLRESRPAPAEVLGDDVALELQKAREAMRSGRADVAVSWTEQAIAQDPEAVRAYGLLAQLQAAQGDLEAAARTIERGSRENPRQRERLRSLEAAAYLRAGDLHRALAVYRASPGTGPFVRRENRLAQIERLERQATGTRSGAGR